MSYIIEMKNIHKIYNNGGEPLQALKGVSLYLEEGEILAIMGSSGSGKSTLLHILGAVDKVSEGEIFLNGELRMDYGVEPSATRIRQENIGFVFQSFKLITDLSVEENVSLPLILAGEKRSKIKEKTREILKLVGIEEKAEKSVTCLSGGQQQRVAIARALIGNPKLLLADEPTGNLDYNTAQEIMQLFLDTKEQRGQSSIIVTHDPMIASFADRILFLHDGRFLGEYENKKGEDNIEQILGIFRQIQKRVVDTCNQKGKLI